MSSERLAWAMTNMDHLLEAGLLVGEFVPRLIAAAVTYRHRRPR
jgi:hypothetical protein